MNQADSVDGLRSVALAIAALAITFVATAQLYATKAAPRRNCPHARVERVHLEYDLHALDASGPHASIVIDVR